MLVFHACALLTPAWLTTMVPGKSLGSFRRPTAPRVDTTLDRVAQDEHTLQCARTRWKLKRLAASPVPRRDRPDVHFDDAMVEPWPVWTRRAGEGNFLALALLAVYVPLVAR